ncbi:hypothetical protein MAPG_02616 [Magnaporthiopsis poae ATCC 64411]|uniref:N-acetyltransferase domain-containing protein n=1 Tax=Magnaporthiopsis poae (strain ATCC 64411 / 73-15) TaxID=644358 RepID=A0A0C4DRV0_MAGP6|nr:hypothetical protein MAPG_02616 [Magnaporthiopsis poae ATCC 64411]
MAPIRITPLGESDIPGVVTAIQTAFDDDPYNNWIFNDKSKFNTKRNAVSLAIRCRWGIRNGMFLVAKEEGSDKVLGVAMWLPPRAANQKQSWGEWFEEWRLYFNQVAMNLRYGRGGLNVKRYYIWKDSQAKAQSEVWTDPRGYYFLNIMVVVPEAQGKGIGKKLMTAVTDRADREQMKCYLESSKDKPNMEIYGRMGYQFAKQVDCDDDGTICRLFSMVRDPLPPAGAGTDDEQAQSQ